MGRGKDKQQRKRKKKSDEAKEATKKKKAAEKIRKDQAEMGGGIAQFLPGAAAAAAAAPSTIDEDDVSMADKATNSDDGDRKKAAQPDDSDDDGDKGPYLRIYDPADITADGDDDDDDDDSDYDPEEEEEVGYDEEEEAFMDTYLKAIAKELNSELSSTGPASDRWLINLIKDNDYWLRAFRAEKVCSKHVHVEPSSGRQPGGATTYSPRIGRERRGIRFGAGGERYCRGDTRYWGSWSFPWGAQPRHTLLGSLDVYSPDRSAPPARSDSCENTWRHQWPCDMWGRMSSERGRYTGSLPIHAFCPPAFMSAIVRNSPGRGFGTTNKGQFARSSPTAETWENSVIPSNNFLILHLRLPIILSRRLQASDVIIRKLSLPSLV